jgi:uncharacterized protein with FMN-binding domain
MRRGFSVLFPLALAAAPCAFADDALRCGNAIVTIGMVAGEVVAKCGEPASKSTEETPVTTRSRHGTVKTAAGGRIERWTYDRGYGQLPALLTFEHGKLKSIELLPNR